MHTPQEVDEVLQALFSMEEEGAGPFAADAVSARAGVSDDAVRQTEQQGLIVRENGSLRLTEQGRADAAAIVRRHRLAERLLHDVLRVTDEQATESAACSFEHFLQDEVTDSICTLLGHPRACPHGNPIPPGACCARKEQNIAAVIQPLSAVRAGDGGTVAYVHTASEARLDRLSSFGLVPGTAFHVHQAWPSGVVALGETLLALDRETAADIFVRTAGNGVRNGSGGLRLRRRRGAGRGDGQA